jgi:hypothetical protein
LLACTAASDDPLSDAPWEDELLARESRLAATDTVTVASRSSDVAATVAAPAPSSSGATALSTSLTLAPLPLAPLHELSDALVRSPATHARHQRQQLVSAAFSSREHQVKEERRARPT